MPEFNEDTFAFSEDNGEELDGTTTGGNITDVTKKQFKKELLEIFRKFGYLGEEKDYEIKIRTTSGNIAWINIKGIETIK